MDTTAAHSYVLKSRRVTHCTIPSDFGEILEPFEARPFRTSRHPVHQAGSSPLEVATLF